VETYSAWTSRVDDDCEFNLSKPLIERDSESNLITVNFNPRLEAVLREVRYLKYMNEETIPDSAAQLYERHDTLRLWVASLRQTVHWYNKAQLEKWSHESFDKKQFYTEKFRKIENLKIGKFQKIENKT